MDEEKAIQLCLMEHDPRGFEFLVDKYRREAYYHSYSWLGNSDDAQDACQDAFSKAYLAMPKLEHLDKFYPWFYRILKNTCLNMLARRKTAIGYIESQSKMPYSGLNPEGNPVENITKQEEQMKVHRILNKLKPEFREILVMKHFNGYSYDEISNLLLIPRGTVMSRLYHARKAFKTIYITEFGSNQYSGKEMN